MSAAAVEVHGLVKRYGTRTALDGLDLHLPRGQILAVLGPNGAGKTTAIEICEGYRRADEGTVSVLGYSPGSPEARARVGVMLQDGIGGYTAARADELLTLFAAYARHPHDPAALLERVGLSDVARVPVKRLSGGQKQRLSLAAALIGRPELVFLDEPTAGMDPQARHGTWDIVSELRGDGVGVVLTTHYLQEAESLADQVVVLDAGRIVAQGTPQELVRGSGDGQLRFACASGLDVDALNASLPAGARVSEGRAGEYLVLGPATPDVIAAVTAWCAHRDVLVTDLSVTRRSLEDVFLDLTGHEIRA